jgi:hypothetical protein
VQNHGLYDIEARYSMINEDLGPSRQLQVLHLRVINDDALNFFLNIHLARLLPDLIGIFDID